MQAMIEEQPKDLGDYIDAVRRRRRPILAVAVTLFVISLLVALLLPPEYRSTATVLIEEQEIPQDLVRSTITTYAWQRIQTISQRVMSRNNLLSIVEKFDLYANKRKRETSEEIIERMRTDIKLEPISANVVDPRTGAPRAATIAFSLSYDSPNPAVAQKVANELTTLYLNENLKSRTEKATETYDFLADETTRIGDHIAELEKKLAEFKEKNSNQLPELTQLNMSLMERTERELMDVQNELRSYEDRKIYLESQLAQMNPNSPMFTADGDRILDSASRLKVLKTEYAAALAKYSPDHPDVLRLAREIDGLEKSTGISVNAREAAQSQAKEILRLRTELAEAEKKYSPDHPDVIKLTRQVQALEESIKLTPATSKAAFIAAEKPENPAYINLQSQMDAVLNGMRAAMRKKDTLKTKLTDYEKRLVQTPQVEREYLDLRRDYENSQLRYRELMTKQMEAGVGQQMEKERKGERFSLVDPPQLPEKPFKPNRMAILLLGFILSICGGLGYALVADSLDRSVRGVRGVSALLGATPLSVIPYIENSFDLAQYRKTKRLTKRVLLTGMVAAVVLVQFLWLPLDVIWFKGLRILNTAIGG
jgi:uncharacterized protein involved in exopolysaccharide biosynthesis